VVVGALGLALLMASCQAVNPHFDATRPHHRPGGFQNNYIGFETKGFGEFMRWRWDAISTGRPPPPQRATPVTAPDLAFLQRNAGAGEAMQPAITWLGHATMLAQFAGLNLVTDPVFSERSSPLSFIGPRRAQPPGLRLDQLPRLDVVLISHNHYDHLDEASVRAPQAQPGGPPLFVVPLGVKAWLAERGITRVVELDGWQSHRLDDDRFFVLAIGETRVLPRRGIATTVKP